MYMMLSNVDNVVPLVANSDTPLHLFYPPFATNKGTLYSE